MANKQFTIQKTDSKEDLFSVPQNSKIKNFVITKKIAKHGRQAVIIIPSILSGQIRPQMLVKLTIDILKDSKEVN